MFSIKEHHLYPLYLEYLKRIGRNKGEVAMMRISIEAFFEFKYNYDTNEEFRERQNNLYKSIVRENKINTILYDKIDKHTKPE